ncbi:MAG: hypothetical protein O6952_08290, partial [Planctomycetota bacterium]|nr:hypothetical protein [Planctomycetota bacterium]
MKVTIKSDNPFRTRTDLLAGFVFEGDKSISLDSHSPPEAVRKALRGPLRDFKGRTGETTIAYGADGSRPQRILLVGLGKKKDFRP